MTIERWIGIDVSKAVLDVHVSPSGEAWSVANDTPGVATLVKRLGRMGATLVVMEARVAISTRWQWSYRGRELRWRL